MELTISMSFHLYPTTPRIPSTSPFFWTGLRKTRHHHHQNRRRHLPAPSLPPKTQIISRLPTSTTTTFPLRLHRPTSRPTSTIVFAGRSKKKPGGPSSGRIEGNAEVRRQAKQNARKRSRRLAENLFYRLSNPRSTNQADQFSEEELEMIGLGYDRTVRFMERDDPNLRHPNDWYKYGQYGPYSWRGVVIGRPIRGRFSDDRVTIIGEVRDHEEWEEIEQFEMKTEFGERLKAMDSGVGFRYFWVFVRHPKWKATDLPWQQWTLVAEVVVEAGENEWLDKWSLMGRLGNKTRALITQCAAWMRPDVIYVRRPVYQCRFEPQDDFFRLLGPMLDPDTEDEYLFELKDGQGRVLEVCTYFAGLCKIVRIGQKAFVDDVVGAYQKLSDDEKSRCLEFLLTNLPMELLHPYTKEWKVKMEEMELGCDAPDESDGEVGDGDKEIVDWVEIDDGEESGEESVDEGVDEYEEEEEEDVINVDAEEIEMEEEEDVEDPGESREHWNKQWNEALKSSDAMEKLVTRRVEASAESYKRQMMEEEKRNREMTEMKRIEEEMNEIAAEAAEMRMSEENLGGEVTATPIVEEAENRGRRGPKRKIKKSRVPPELFLRAAVRPFTYRNLVKEIVLLRHAIIDKEVNPKG